MKLFSFLQHKRRIMFMISLPQTEEFNKLKKEVNDCIQQLIENDVVVKYNISQSELSEMSKYDIVIVVAHLDEDSNQLVLSDGSLDVAEFVGSIPTKFHGYLDFSSCNSKLWVNSIKQRCPNCHVQAALHQTTLAFRLAIYPFVVQLLKKNRKLSYPDAYRIVKQKVLEVREKYSSSDDHSLDEVTVLGKKHYSSIYAQSKVVRNTPFLVQVFLYDDSVSTEKITLQAKKLDPHTGEVETQELPIKLKKGDKIAINYSVISSEEKHIRIVDNPTKQITWAGISTKIQFAVIVSNNFSDSSFLNRILIEVNHNPIGECYFHSIVSDKKDEAPADINIQPHNYEEERSQSYSMLKKQLSDNYDRLKLKVDTGKCNNEERQMSETIMNTCLKCLHLIDNPVKDLTTGIPKSVFISSTCEDFMKPYREVIRDVVSELKMKPEMCGDWPQSGCNPADVCCQKVMESDIYLCLLGARYGYIEPSLNTSMTEMEFQAALSTGKTIFAFIIDPLNVSDEPKEKRVRQELFINYLKKNRILRLFKDRQELKDSAKDDLLSLISSKKVSL